MAKLHRHWRNSLSLNKWLKYLRHRMLLQLDVHVGNMSNVVTSISEVRQPQNEPPRNTLSGTAADLPHRYLHKSVTKFGRRGCSGPKFMKTQPHRQNYAPNFRHYVHTSGRLTNGLVVALVGRTDVAHTGPSYLLRNESLTATLTRHAHNCGRV